MEGCTQYAEKTEKQRVRNGLWHTASGLGSGSVYGYGMDRLLDSGLWA